MLSPAHQQFFKTLGNPKRIELMLLLMKKPMTVSELMKRMGMEQSTLSHHLKRLKLCTFVTSKVNGKERIYTVNQKTMKPLLQLMHTHVKKYCQRLCTCPSDSKSQ